MAPSTNLALFYSEAYMLLCSSGWSYAHLILLLSTILDFQRQTHHFQKTVAFTVLVTGNVVCRFVEFCLKSCPRTVVPFIFGPTHSLQLILLGRKQYRDNISQEWAKFQMSQKPLYKARAYSIDFAQYFLYFLFRLHNFCKSWVNSML